MKLTTAFWLVAIFIVPTAAIAQKKAPASTRSEYVNYKYKGVAPENTLPNGVKHLGGSLVGDIDADPVHGVSSVRKGNVSMLWLEVSTGRDATGVTGWQVKDVLSFPGLTKADHLFFISDPAIYCRRNGTDIPNLVGVGRTSRSQGVFRPSKLWTVNLKTERFEPASLAGVKCEYSEP